MAILVVCTKCKARFQVSEKFAGQKGPCPKCKNVITIPDKTEEVKIHAPETFGPKGATGKAVLKPIFREETKWSPVAAGVIVGVVVLTFVLAYFVGQASIVEKQDRKGETYQVTEVNFFVLALGSLLIAPPLAFGAYTMLRSSELEPLRGQDLWIRVGAVSLAYPLLWGVVGFMQWALDYQISAEVGMLAASLVLLVMLGVGGGIGHLVFELEYGPGVVHYGLYLLVTVLLRLTAGLAIV